MTKRIALTIIVLLTAVSLYAGDGKECNLKSAAKSVELNGTLAQADGAEHAIFRVANSDQSYTVCEKTKKTILKLGNGGRDTLHVKGKLVSCGDNEEFLIEEARKI